MIIAINCTGHESSIIKHFTKFYDACNATIKETNDSYNQAVSVNLQIALRKLKVSLHLHDQMYALMRERKNEFRRNRGSESENGIDAYGCGTLFH